MSGSAEQGEPGAETGDPAPVTRRARFKVNKPAPKALTFGTGEPSFVKAGGRSPGAPAPLAESG
ncbi:MAG: hypothetical protein ACAI25_08365, partial [Planctomycetota bacterium]